MCDILKRETINQLIVDLVADHYAKNDAAFDSVVLEVLRGLNAETTINSQLSAVKLLKLIDYQGAVRPTSAPARNLSAHAALDPKMVKLETVHGSLATTPVPLETRSNLVRLFPHDSVNTRGRFLITGKGTMPTTLAKLIAGGSLRKVITLDVSASLNAFTKSGGGS